MAPQQTDLPPSRTLDGASRRAAPKRRGRRQLNPRQRQGALLLVVAAAGLIGVFALIASYVSNVAKQVGPKIQVVELKTPLQPYEPVSPSMLGYVTVPQKWAAPNALRNLNDAVSLVSNRVLPAGTRLQRGMLGAAPTIQANEQEMAVFVDAETGVAGQVTAGSEVSIVATYSGDNSKGKLPSARVVVPRATVLGVGTPTTAGGSASASSQPAAQNAVVPVTFALTPKEVLAVSYAESFAQKVRLVLHPPGSGTSESPPPYAPGF